jgi:hypothetical protein
MDGGVGQATLSVVAGMPVAAGAAAVAVVTG